MMTNARYRDVLAMLRISQRELARMLRCSTRLAADWGVGKQSVPPVIEEWLERCVDVRERHPFPPPPTGWRRREPFTRRVKAETPSLEAVSVRCPL